MATARHRPARLREGASVALVAPAGPVPVELLEPGIGVLRSWGLRVDVGAHVRDRHPRLNYLAGTDRARAEDLQAAWCDPAYDAVFCVRGGYGSLRVLDLLDWSAMAEATARRPDKLFIGSSDITALHVTFGHRLGVATVFGPMVATHAFVDETEDPASAPPAREQLRRLLFAPDSARELHGPRASTLFPGTAHGILFGGNTSLLAATVGAADPPLPPSGAIAVLEDVAEEPYRLDSMLTQLLRAGWFDNVAGIALGSWQDCGDPERLRSMLLDRLAPLGVPIVQELGFGHCPRQLSLPLGVPATLDADGGTLLLDQPAPG